MSKIFWVICIIFIQMKVQASECTDFLWNEYYKSSSEVIKILSKKEYKIPFLQIIQNKQTSSICYGEGVLKQNKFRKTQINYFCIFDSENKPVWGKIISY